MLKVTDLQVRFRDKTALNRLSFSVGEGDWLMVIGPNGAGKSTLVRAIAGGVAYEGQIRFYGQDVSCMKPHERGRAIGVLSQNQPTGYAFTVEEVVRLGRYAYAPGLFSSHEGEERAVEEALRETGLYEMRRRTLLTLSGGERQRVFLAQTFAQSPQLLLLDEPVNHLDLPYQREIFAYVKNWLAAGNRAVVCVVHDLSLTRLYGNRVLLLQGGRVQAQGTPEEVLKGAAVNETYGMDVGGYMRELLKPWA